MALKLVINISKKVPGPQEYSSIQAACTIEGEVSQGQDPVAEAARLYAQAEAAVDAQLRIQAVTTAPPRATPPPKPSGSARGSCATPSQLQLLLRLIGSNQPQVTAICQHYGTSDLASLSVRQASEAIDQLKGPKR